MRIKLRFFLAKPGLTVTHLMKYQNSIHHKIFGRKFTIRDRNMGNVGKYFCSCHEFFVRTWSSN